MEEKRWKGTFVAEALVIPTRGVSAVTFADDINRLFDELVHVPWSRSTKSSPVKPAGHETELEFEIPVAGDELGDLSISLRGRELLVRARRRCAASDGTAGLVRDATLEQSFVVPDGAEVSAVEARIKDGLLHVRVRLRTAG